MYKVYVYVTFKEGVLDPQGKAIQESMHSLAYDEVEGVRVGKYFELTVKDTGEIDKRVNELCDRLLANPVIEEYRYTLEEVVPN